MLSKITIQYYFKKQKKKEKRGKILQQFVLKILFFCNIDTTIMIILMQRHKMEGIRWEEKRRNI